ncbi:MAG: zf-TFIIB domain-containing protein [Gemmatimonadota bacterium]
MAQETTSEGLRNKACGACGGRWVELSDYWRWRASGVETEGSVATTSIVLAEEALFRACPSDGYRLAQYDVGDPLAFSLDQCRNCGGVWFDGGEWESLIAHRLSDQLPLILSDEWQSRVQEAARRDLERKQWERQLGADLGRIEEIKSWLDEHPKRSELYAFLNVHGRVE